MGRKEDRGMNVPDKVRQKVTGDPAECISEQKEDLVLLWRQSGAADPLSLRNLELWCRCGHKYRKIRLETSINRNGIHHMFYSRTSGKNTAILASGLHEPLDRNETVSPAPATEGLSEKHRLQQRARREDPTRREMKTEEFDWGHMNAEV